MEIDVSSVLASSLIEEREFMVVTFGTTLFRTALLIVISDPVKRYFINIMASLESLPSEIILKITQCKQRNSLFEPESD